MGQSSVDGSDTNYVTSPQWLYFQDIGRLVKYNVNIESIELTKWFPWIYTYVRTYFRMTNSLQYMYHLLLSFPNDYDD